MRVALFTYGTQPRGGVVHALALGEALHDLGHDSCVFGLDETGRGFYREPRCPHVVVPFEGGATDIVVAVRRRIDAYVAALQDMPLAFDVYHAHDGISANALATLVERGALEAFVRTVHHVDAFARHELAALQDRSIVSAARAFVVSRLWQRELRARYGVAATVIPNGVDLQRFTPGPRENRTALRRRFGVNAAPLFVSIGGVEARKNALRILQAFALARATRPGARLVVAGGASAFDHGAYRRDYGLHAAELGLRIGDHVVIAGVVDDEAIVALLRAADALVFPSLVEGFGLVLLEALACGTPVIASAIPPFTEFLNAADASFVDPYDVAAIANGMLRALEPNVALRSLRRGPRVAAGYSWRASALAHLEQYGDSIVTAKEPVRA